ncbi:MAG: phosphate transport system regulatory protein PhoU [Elusimicrobia bacterium RIFOXYB2_FULL_50_12]|nr:MAG: phosphate transport system regulatory protein PhoU [Elusimicrobia bacterium RIFOXYB2_FULL_50_12]
MLAERLLSLKKQLVEYSGVIESMVGKSMKGLLLKNKAFLVEVIEQDEPKVNELEVEVDELCTNMIAQYQPRAKDLRMILMALKMNNDLERMGDHAVNIAESGLYLIERPQVKPFKDIPLMSEAVMRMLKDCIDAFVNGDAQLAKSVCERDNVVDDFKDKILAELVHIMNVDPSAIERSLHLLRISGNLERIADLSTNIGEEVMFMVEGRVIKHHHKEENS